MVCELISILAYNLLYFQHPLYDNNNFYSLLLEITEIGYRAVEKGGKAVILDGNQNSKGAQDSEIYLILSQISLFWKKVIQYS